MSGTITYERNFGQYNVSIEGDQITIVGDTNSNFGDFYPSAFERFRNHPEGREHDWNRPQVIGMEWEYGMTGQVKDWIYGLIHKGKLDHLIEQEQKCSFFDESKNKEKWQTSGEELDHLIKAKSFVEEDGLEIATKRLIQEEPISQVIASLHHFEGANVALEEIVDSLYHLDGINIEVYEIAEGLNEGISLDQSDVKALMENTIIPQDEIEDAYQKLFNYTGDASESGGIKV